MNTSGLAKDFTGPIAAPIYQWTGPGTFVGGVAQVDQDWFEEYPRCHLLSTGEILFSAYAPRWAKVDHDVQPGAWTWAALQAVTGQPPGYSSNWQQPRHDGSSVLFPNFGGVRDVVVRVGGANQHFYGTSGPLETTATM